MKIFLSSKTNLHSGIYLPDGQPVIIGRNKTTKIADIRCSRYIIKIVANGNIYYYKTFSRVKISNMI